MPQLYFVIFQTDNLKIAKETDFLRRTFRLFYLRMAKITGYELPANFFEKIN